MVYDLIIVGSGAAGLSAGLYAGRYNMKVLIVRGEFGGESATGGVFWNYPGTGPIDGYELMRKMESQAKDVGSELIDGKVLDIKRNGHCFDVVVQDGNKPIEHFGARTIILANGAERRKLGLPLEKELLHKGVHYCVTCDGPVYVDKTIAVIGGGDAAVKGVSLAGQFAKKVYLIVRGTDLRAEPVNIEEMKKLGDKVEIIYGTEVKELVGVEKLEKIILTKTYNGSDELLLDGIFIEIGTLPNVTIAKSLGSNIDDKGYVMVDNSMKTNVDGLFACGDAVNFFGSFKQAITAAAMGAVAATSAYQDYKVHGELCQIHWIPTELEK
ncbi:MAG: FAD-dependent oxidoreductase [Candidatus Vogelbacteria bacterium]|nr:FAD-dependent oxidoreductase [Candidatus Vogelbacteria bacterium]